MGVESAHRICGHNADGPTPGYVRGEVRADIYPGKPGRGGAGDEKVADWYGDIGDEGHAERNRSVTRGPAPPALRLATNDDIVEHLSGSTPVTGDALHGLDAGP